VNWLISSFGLILAIPTVILLVEVIVGCFGTPKIPLSSRRPKSLVIVPAHNEELGIGATANLLKDQLAQDDLLLVVADNCTDQTASIARSCGAVVLERTNLDQRGKGFAIAAALVAAESIGPEVVIFVDADCRLSPGAIEHLTRAVAANDTAIQASNNVEVSPNADPRAVLSMLAFIIKNTVRPAGLARLGFTVPLTGTGMAMPFSLAKALPFNSGHLAEDMELGLKLLSMGRIVKPTAQASVYSTQPADPTVAMAQRRRWEHGHLDLIVRSGVPTIFGGILRLSPRSVVAGFDLCVPPLALLFVMLLIHLLISCFYLLMSGDALPAFLSLGLTSLLVIAVLFAKLTRAPKIPLSTLALVPLYILWKIPMYLRFFAGRKQSTWVRTDRV